MLSLPSNGTVTKSNQSPNGHNIDTYKRYPNEEHAFVHSPLGVNTLNRHHFMVVFFVIAKPITWLLMTRNRRQSNRSNLVSG